MVWEVRNVEHHATGIRQATGSAQRNEKRNRTEVGKFSAQEITALKDKDDLVARVQAKYQLDRPQAQRDVDAFAKGRQL